MNNFKKKEVRLRPPQASWNTTAATTPRQKAGTKRKEEPMEEVEVADMGPSSPPVLLLPPAGGVMVVEGVGILRPHHPYMCHNLLGWKVGPLVCTPSHRGRYTVYTCVYPRLQHCLQDEASPLWHLLTDPHGYVFHAPSIGPHGGQRHGVPSA